MRVTKKVLKIIVMLVIILNIFQEVCFAAVSFPSAKDIFDSGKNFLTKGQQGGTKFSDDDIINFVVPLANILIAIGTIVIIAVFIIIGIKYMMATPEEAAKLKHQLIGTVVAGIVIFGAVMIWRIMYDIMESVENSL